MLYPQTALVGLQIEWVFCCAVAQRSCQLPQKGNDRLTLKFILTEMD